MAKIAVTGASGLVGAALIRALRERDADHEVRALYNSSPRGFDDVSVTPAKVDIMDPASLREAFAGADVVYHSAAHVSTDPRLGETTRRTNVEGTRNVIEACERTGVRRLVHVSSVHALCQTPLEHPLDENRKLLDTAEVTPYVRSKAQAELLVMEAAARGLEAVIVCPSGIMGPYDYRPTQTGQMLFDLYAGRIPALLPGGHDWVDSRDVAVGAIAAAERGRAGERYILSGTWAGLTELADLVAYNGGARAPRMVMPLPLARLAAHGAELYGRFVARSLAFNREAVAVLQRTNSKVSSAKAADELGYAARPLADTVRDTMAWGLERGLIRASRRPSTGTRAPAG